MKKATVWTGTYRDIDYTIIREDKDFDEVWWFAKVKWSSEQVPVLYDVVKTQLSKEYIYYRHRDLRLDRVERVPEIVLNSLDVLTRPGDDTEYYTITWDYMHSWQEGHNYDENTIFYDIRNAIDALIGAFEEEDE